MWGKAIYGAVGSALDKVQKVASELESQLDAAVGRENNILPSNTIDNLNNNSNDINIETNIYEYQNIDENINNLPDNNNELILLKSLSTNGNDFVEVENIEISPLKVDNRTIYDSVIEESMVIPSINDNSSSESFGGNILKNEHDKFFDDNDVDTILVDDIITTESIISNDNDTRNSESIIELASPIIETKSTDNTIISMEIIVNKIRLEYEGKFSKNAVIENDLRNEINRQNIEIKELANKFSLTNEILQQRERTLESTSNQLSKLINTIEQLEQANLQLVERESMLKTQLVSMQSLSSTENDLRKQIVKLQDQINEKDERLAAFESEGQILSKRQGEMEKLVRKFKSEIKEKDNDISKLKDSKEQLVKAIEELQDVIRKNEAETSTSNKNLIALQAVTQATGDKAQRLEGELASRLDELSAVKKALESSWNEINDMKRHNTELRSERDELRRQIGEGTNKVLETESNRREIEQREAILRATSKQLQENLQRQMTEASIREERLREELNEMRRRWQDAITSRENLSTELSSATTPLLRQISTLQDNLRFKSDQWSTLEANLNERAIIAENQLHQSEKTKLELEFKLSTISQQLHSIKKQNQELIDQLNQSSEEINNLNQKFDDLNTSFDKLKNDHELLIDKFNSSEKELLLFQRKYQNIQQTYEDSIYAIQQLQSTINSKDLELKKLKDFIDRDSKPFDISNTTPKKNISIVQSPSLLPSGDSSFAHSERLHQQYLKKEEEVNALVYQLKQIQSSRDALLEEVSYLTDRNSALDEQLKSNGLISNKSLKQQNDLLLAMLGEKEEEIEGLLSDMKDVKLLYQNEIQTLLDRVLVFSSSSKRND